MSLWQLNLENDMNKRLHEFAAAVAVAGTMAVIALLILIDVLGSAYEAGGF